MADGTIIFEAQLNTEGIKADAEDLKKEISKTTTFEVQTKGTEQAKADISKIESQKESLSKPTTVNVDTKGTEQAVKSVDSVSSSVSDTRIEMANFDADSQKSFNRFVDGAGLAGRALLSPRAMILLIAKTVKEIGSATIFGNANISAKELESNISSLNNKISITSANIEKQKAKLLSYAEEQEAITKKLNKVAPVVDGERIVSYKARPQYEELIAQENAINVKKKEANLILDKQTIKLKEQQAQLKIQKVQQEQLLALEKKKNMAKSLALSLGIMLGIDLAIKGISALIEKIKKQREEMLKNLKKIGEYLGKTLLNIVEGIFTLSVNRIKQIVSTISSLSSTLGSFISDLLEIKGTSFVDFMTSANDETSKWAILLTEVKTRWQLLSATVGKSLQNVFYPFLEIMNYALKILQEIAGYVAQITSAIFGDSSSLAKGLDGVSLSSDNANDSLSDLNDTLDETKNGLASFDKLNVLNQQETKSVDTTKGLQQSVSLAIKNIAGTSLITKIKEAIRRGDWFSVGEEIGNSISNALAKINWTNIKAKLKNIAENLADILNGFIKGTNWKVVGKSIAEAINTYLNTANTFLETFDFYGFGEAIAQAFVSWLNSVNPKEYGRYIANLINMIIKSSAGFVSKFTKEGGWKALGEAIVDGVNTLITNLKVTEFVDAVSETISGIMQTVITIATTTVDENGTTLFQSIGKALGTAFKRFIDNLDPKEVAETIKSIITAIVDLIRNFFESVGDVNEWKKVGSKVGDVISGVLSDEAFVNNILNTIKVVTEDITALIEGFLESETVDWGRLAEIWLGVQNGYEGIKKKVDDVVWKIKENLGETWYQKLGKILIGDNGESTIKGIGVGSTVTSMLQVLFDQLFGNEETAVKETAPKAKAIGEGVGGNVKEGFKTAVKLDKSVDEVLAGDGYETAGQGLGKQFNEGFIDNATKEKINGKTVVTFDAVTNSFKNGQLLGNSLKEGLLRAVKDIPTLLSDVFKNAWDRVKKVFSDRRGVGSILYSVEDTFRIIINQLIDGLNNTLDIAFSDLNRAFDNLRNWTLNGRRPFNNLPYMSAPYVPKLATGMYIPANYGSFLAELGDNRREPEVVSPISAIKQAVKEVAGTGSIDLHIYLDSKEVFNSVVDRNNEFISTHGYSALAKR